MQPASLRLSSENQPHSRPIMRRPACGFYIISCVSDHENIVRGYPAQALQGSLEDVGVGFALFVIVRGYLGANQIIYPCHPLVLFELILFA